MITDKDIIASAKIYMERYGQEALPKALEKIQNFEIQGDERGREVWNKIAWAINWMQNPSTSANEVVQ